MRQHLLSLAAEKQPLHPPPSVGSHDDEIALPFLSSRDDGFIGLVAFFLGGFARYARLFGRLLDREEVFSHFRLNGCCSLLFKFRADVGIETEMAQLGSHAEARYSGVDGFCKLNAFPHRGLG